MLLPVLGPVSVSTRTLASEGIGYLEILKNPANLLKNNLNNTKNYMKFQIQNNNNNNNNNNYYYYGGIVELLIPKFFQKIASDEGIKTILCKKIMGRLF